MQIFQILHILSCRDIFLYPIWSFRCRWSHRWWHRCFHLHISMSNWRRCRHQVRVDGQDTRLRPCCPSQAEVRSHVPSPPAYGCLRHPVSDFRSSRQRSLLSCRWSLLWLPLRHEYRQIRFWSQMLQNHEKHRWNLRINSCLPEFPLRHSRY